MPAQNSRIELKVTGQLDNAMDLGAASYPLSYTYMTALADGTGANQAKEIFSDTRTLTASANEDLDLSGVLLDAFGAAILFTKIKAILITADPANVNDVVVGGAATNQVASIFGAVTHTIKVKPGGMFAIVAPDVNGYAITAATGDLLRVTNGGAGTSVTYTIIVIGTT
jgi:hypothetical protein